MASVCTVATRGGRSGKALHTNIWRIASTVVPDHPDLFPSFSRGVPPTSDSRRAEAAAPEAAAAVVAAPAAAAATTSVHGRVFYGRVLARPSPPSLGLRRACATFPLPSHSNIYSLPSPSTSSSLPFCSASSLPSSSPLPSAASPVPSSEFPGARMPLSPALQFVPEVPDKPVPCFRVTDQDGKEVEGADMPEIDELLATRMYTHMVRLQAMDNVFYEAQRQGRFSFYMTTAGEEAVNIASAAGISDQDHIFAQYREPGVLLWRGFSLSSFANQCLGNQLDVGKGRQMPVHYGSKELRFHTISSPLATQIPHAVGAAYGLKVAGEAACAVAYFGEGAASEGDFHAALNFSSVLESPVLFICRNNGWAISTPAKEQYRGDGIAGRGAAYGISSVRVDGNDALAVLRVVREARRRVVEGGKPILVEAMTYRTGHHSTSDDSSRYRGASEMSHWKTQRDPVNRFKRWMERRGWWDEGREEEERAQARREVIDALDAAEKLPKPPLSALFTDVYDSTPPHLQQQEREVREAVARNPKLYPSDVPID